VKFETWHQPNENPRTKDWKSINNERRRLVLSNNNKSSHNNSTSSTVYVRSNNHVNYLRHSSSPSSTTNVTTATPEIQQQKQPRPLRGELRQHRALKKGGAKTPEYCDQFTFEFSIDGGEVTSWNQEQFLQNKHDIQRVVEIVTLAEDPGLTGGVEKEVEVAFRMTGCGSNGKTFQLTHVYWA
jgi:hypothetical protein